MRENDTACQIATFEATSGSAQSERCTAAVNSHTRRRGHASSGRLRGRGGLRCRRGVGNLAVRASTRDNKARVHGAVANLRRIVRGVVGGDRRLEELLVVALIELWLVMRAPTLVA